ncbi:MAG: putative cupin domain protein, partial [uncultured Nocardioidaceae bacterium]
GARSQQLRPGGRRQRLRERERAGGPVRHQGRPGAGHDGAVGGRDPHLGHQHPAHPGPADLVREGPQRRGLPVRPPPPRRGRDGGLRPLGARPDLLRRDLLRLPRHVRGRLGLRAAVHAPRRVQPRPQPAAHLDDDQDAREHRRQPPPGRRPRAARLGRPSV